MVIFPYLVPDRVSVFSLRTCWQGLSLGASVPDKEEPGCPSLRRGQPGAASGANRLILRKD